MVRADRTRLRQVLLNLLSNAIKFTDQGEVVLRASAIPDWVTISVADTGIGIHPEDIPKAFTEFVQLEGGLSRPVGGTGLGLPITKRFVELQGGRIWAESEPGKGSTFYFTIPTSLAMQKAETSETLLEATVVVIDDDPAARQALAQQLSQSYSVLPLIDSRQAVERVREMHPDVVVLDVMMPFLDGWDVLKTLKSDPATQDIPVVVCSIMREQGMATSFGADDYLVKPVSAQALMRAVARFAPPGGKVLAVDDDEDALEIIRRMLGGMAYHVISATDGASGLDVIRERIPDVVLLDLMMPGMNGFEILSKLRADPATKDLPVIVVTAKDLTNEEREILRSEAAFLLQKGQFSHDELKRLVRNAILRGVYKGGAHGKS
jgi:CheY-like chemotaxis protein